MPLLSYNSDADWDLAYPPRPAVHPGSPYYPDWSDPYHAWVEWLQPDGTWGGYDTRLINSAGSDFRRAKRFAFSFDPKEWQRQAENDLSIPYNANTVPQIFRSRRNRIVQSVGGFTVGQTVLVVGAGTNGLAAAFVEAGYDAYGLDNSDWILNHPKGAIWEPTRRIHADMQANNILSVLSSAAGTSQFDHVIDEQFFIGFTDAELIATRKIQGVDWRFIDEPERFLAPGGQYIHFIIAGDEWIDPTVVNVHTKPWWEALNSNHIWLNTFEA